MMELNKPWEARDFKALVKRIYCGAGNVAGTNNPTPAEQAEWKNVAQACEFFLKCYNKSKGE